MIGLVKRSRQLFEAFFPNDDGGAIQQRLVVFRTRSRWRNIFEVSTSPAHDDIVGILRLGYGTPTERHHAGLHKPCRFFCCRRRRMASPKGVGRSTSIAGDGQHPVGLAERSVESGLHRLAVRTYLQYLQHQVPLRLLCQVVSHLASLDFVDTYHTCDQSLSPAYLRLTMCFGAF